MKFKYYIIRCLACLLLVFCQLSFSQDAKFLSSSLGALKNTLRGKWQAINYFDIEDDDPFENTYALFSRLSLENKIDFSDSNISLFSSLDIDYELNRFGVRSEKASVLLKEAYINLEKSNWSIRLGKQIVTWGKLDDFIVLDRINPQNYKHFVLFDKQERKIPTAMVKFQAAWDRWRIETVYIPIFKPSYLNFFGSDWALFGYTKEAIERGSYSASVKDRVRKIEISDKNEITKKNLKTGQAGLRVAASLLGWDWSIYYMNIFNSVAALREKTAGGNTVKEFLYVPSENNLTRLASASLAGDDLTLDAQYKRQNVIGLDWEGVLGQFGIRGEAAFLSSQPYLARNFSYLTKDTVFLGIGIDHTTASDLYFDLQAVESAVLSYKDLFSQEEFTHQVTANVKKGFLRGRLSPELDFAWNLSRGDSMFNPQVTYKFNNGFNVCVGGFVFEGDSDTVFGRFASKDLAYLKLGYQF